MAALPRYYEDTHLESRNYRILDRKRGSQTVLAEVYDPEMAARIVRLLNADVEAAARQGAVVP